MWCTNFQFFKNVFCAAIIFIAVQNSVAQSYSHAPNDSIIAKVVYNDVNVYNIIQNHLNNDTLFFKWKKHFVSLPKTWEASICDVGHCYTSLVDSSTMDPVLAGDNGLISLHLNPYFESGTGKVQVLFWEVKTPQRIDTLTWIITASGTTANKIITQEKIVSIFPNPTAEILNISTSLENGFQYSIIDILGKVVLHSSSSKNKCTINTKNLPKGQYYLQIYNNQKSINTIFIIKEELK